jgi:carboxypeptidase PM20D1
VTSRKKVGFLAGAGIGAAAAVALRRRWSGVDGASGAASLQPTAATGQGERAAAFLAHLAEAVRFETVSREDPSLMDFTRFEAFRDFLEQTYPLVHDSLEKETVAGHSLLFRWEGSDPSAQPIMLLAHQDVVPVEPDTEDAWERPPFAGEQRDGFLYGRGTLDDKASLVGILEAVESLLADGFRPGPDVYLGFGHDEEAGGAGAGEIAEILATRGVRFWLVLDEGGAVGVEVFPGVTEAIALIGIGEKGYADVTLTAAGAGGHSSAPPASTAIGRVAAAVRSVEENPMPARLEVQHRLFAALGSVTRGIRGAMLQRADRTGRLLEKALSSEPVTNALIRTTAAATMVDGGVKPNVLPQSATALVNFRIMPGDTLDDVLGHVRRVVPDDVDVGLAPSSFAADPPPLADPESPQFDLVASIVAEHFEIGAIAPWILTGATDSRHFVGIADQVLRFVPVTASADDFSRFHGTGERVRVSDADAVVGFYRALLQRAGG